MQEAVRRLQETGLAPADALEGCSESEIQSLERSLGVALPGTYREFLTHAGKRVGQFLTGSDLTYEWLREQTNHARELAREEGLELPPGAFAFVGHQGYQFLFFVTDTGEDPVVYRCLEGEGIEQVRPSFTDWLLGAIDDEADQARSLGLI